MNTIIKYVLLTLLVFANFAYAKDEQHHAITQPIVISDLNGFTAYPLIVQRLIAQATQLTQQNLTYLYGSADPKRRGMDCSGTIYYLLKNSNVADVPRSSEQIYQWARSNGVFYTVNSHDLTSIELAKLKPGDLLFWSGTYKTVQAGNISHVMLYLGKNNHGEPLMFGSSDGRTYRGKQMWGVSIFDFKLPNADSNSHFIGYSCIPHLTCGNPQ